MPDSRLESLRRRVELNPASPAFTALAEECRKAGLFDEAIEIARTGLERFPTYLSARVTLGRALVQVGALEEAREHLEEVVRQAPENLAAIRALADIHHRQGDPEGSDEVDLLTAALEQDVAAASSAPPSAPESSAREAASSDLAGGDAWAPEGSLESGFESLDDLFAPPPAPAEGNDGDPGSPAAATDAPDEPLQPLDRESPTDRGVDDAGAVTLAFQEVDVSAGPSAGADLPDDDPDAGLAALQDMIVRAQSTGDGEGGGDALDAGASTTAAPAGTDPPLDGDPRVVKGLERFLDAILARRGSRH